LPFSCTTADIDW